MLEFTVVMRAPSAAVFAPGESVSVEIGAMQFGPARVVYRTRDVRHGATTIFGDLWIEIKGEAPSLADGIRRLANLGLVGISIIAFSTNAAVGGAEVELAFDSTKDVKSREFFQAYIPPERPLACNWRVISPTDVAALASALNVHPERERLLRAANHYLLALRDWKLGSETIAVAHLWMAVETMTPVVLSAQRKTRNLATNKELAAALDVPLDQLDATIRKTAVFCDDDSCYSIARKASDGFEHGYLGFDELQSRSASVRVAAAGYVRKALLDLIGIGEDVRINLMAPRFAEPMGQWPIAKYFWGTLEGATNQLALPGMEYPHLEWTPTIKTLAINDQKGIDVTFEDSWSKKFGEGITLTEGKLELWRA